MNGLLAAYVGSQEFKAMVNMGRAALPEIIRLGNAYERGSSRYRNKNACDRFMIYAAAQVLAIDPDAYPDHTKFWAECEKIL